uniref:Uncharacterized protein n=1 Tax=Neogobius melanostomus TaxID=47308 RepID=A0A8C6SEA5_9GOBI
MSSVSCTLSEEQFLCSICLEVFSAPVTTPCGHSFCRACINQHWDNSDHCNCPVCKQAFNTKPQLKVNIVLAEMVFEFKNTPQVDDVVVESVILEPQSAAEEVVGGVSAPAGEDVCDVSAPAGEEVCGGSAKGGEVLCDMCPDPRLQALKSCLVCLASYCQSHLQPHLTNPRLGRHQLIEAVPNLEERVCPEHDRPLELFCKDHSHFICLDCTSAGHKDHEAVPLKEECEVQQTEVKEQIKQRLQKIAEIRGSVELSQKNADTEIQEGIRVFNNLIEGLQQSLDSFKQSIEEKHRKSEEEAAQMIEQIQAEISVLEQRGTEMEQLWSSGDHLQFVQTFTSVRPAPQLNEWKTRKISATYGVMLAEAVSEWKNNQLCEDLRNVLVPYIKRFQQYDVDVKLDGDTAHQNIWLENYSTKAQYKEKERGYLDKPDRFSSKHFVLGRQAFSSGKFYFEVCVKGSRDWSVGVVKESVERKRNIWVTPNNGFWLIKWNDEKSVAKLGIGRLASPKCLIQLECMWIMKRVWSLSLMYMMLLSLSL